MNDLEQAHADVQAAQAALNDLLRAQTFLDGELPPARAALTAAHARLRRAKTANGAADEQRKAELAALSSAIDEVRNHV